MPKKKLINQSNIFSATDYIPNYQSYYHEICYHHEMYNIDGLVQDCSNSSAIATELLHSCTKLSILSKSKLHFIGKNVAPIRESLSLQWYISIIRYHYTKWIITAAMIYHIYHITPNRSSSIDYYHIYNIISNRLSSTDYYHIYNMPLRSNKECTTTIYNF